MVYRWTKTKAFSNSTFDLRRIYWGLVLVINIHSIIVSHVSSNKKKNFDYYYSYDVVYTYMNINTTTLRRIDILHFRFIQTY